MSKFKLKDGNKIENRENILGRKVNMERLTSCDEMSGMGVLILEEEQILSQKGFLTTDESNAVMRHLAERLCDYENKEELQRVRKIRLYVDMDGTIAKWMKASIETVASKGYFKNLPPMENTLSAVKRIITEDNGVEVFILSSVFQDDHSIQDKKEWLEKFLPELSEENMIFVPFGNRKGDYVTEQGAFLLDDFSKNLHEWAGIGIKMYNGINGTHGTWHGYSICSNMMPDVMYYQLLGILYKAEQ